MAGVAAEDRDTGLAAYRTLAAASGHGSNIGVELTAFTGRTLSVPGGMICSMSWRPGVEERLGYYVYLLVDPRDGKPFYVGKGTGGRCFSHVGEAHKPSRDSKGDYEKLATIRGIEDAGHRVSIEILRHGLTEDEAFHVESAAIELLGFSDLTNRVVGHGTDWVGWMGVDDVNAQYGAVPVDFDPLHKVILIRSRRFGKVMGEDALYEATRVWWRVGSRRLKADYAMAVRGGVVRAVYKIDGWVKPTEEDIAKAPNRLGRHGFVGHVDPEMEERYLFADVTAFLPERGGRNPIRYVNC